MKREPSEKRQTDDRPNLIEKPVAEASFVCRHATREKGERRKGRRTERVRKENECVPSYD